MDMKDQVLSSHECDLLLYPSGFPWRWSWNTRVTRIIDLPGNQFDVSNGKKKLFKKFIDNFKIDSGKLTL